MSSSLLWKAFYEHDVESFRHLLETATSQTRRHATRTIAPATPGSAPTGSLSGNGPLGSPSGGLGTSPVLNLKSRKGTAHTLSALGVTALTRADINWRDSSGLTLLHHIASSTAEDALGFAAVLIAYPLTDLYLQDVENGWTALHRAFYFGNISIARLMLERDVGDATGRTTGHIHQGIGLIKVKDREGHGPLDLYAATIKDRTLRPDIDARPRRGSGGSEEERPSFARNADDDDGDTLKVVIAPARIDGDQLFTFGSNQNVCLGFGDEDDRQFPERIVLRRPEYLIRRFLAEHNEQVLRKWSSHDSTFQPPITTVDPSGWVEDIPWMIRSKPLHIEDVQMAKMSTAVITSDPESNLYMCGHGQGGRLGVGDEQTRFGFTCINGGALAGKRIVAVALGQHHTLALSNEGEIFSWGNNRHGQLGYSLPRTATGDEDPISTLPRQIFGILKREIVIGVAASRVHSVAHTSTSLFTFGKNDGQLGLVDSDARSLDVQITPRKVAASLFTTPIASVAAIERATICLLENHEVWVLANYGYLRVPFPLDGFSNYFLQQSFLATSYDRMPNHIVKVTGGGDTICALASRGEIYTVSVKEQYESQAHASTTNPAKIRNAITQPQCVWSPRKANMAAKDVGVDADGSIILSTEEGSVWKRSKRVSMKDTTALANSEYKPKDFKFSRIPGLTRVLGVRASAYGAYAAVRRDCDVLKTQIVVEDPLLWSDLFPLLSLRHLVSHRHNKDVDDSTPRFWQKPQPPNKVQALRKAISHSKDIEGDLEALHDFRLDSNARYDAVITTTTSDVAIPIHRFMLSARSKVLRRGFRDLCQTSTFTVLDLAVSEIDKDGRTVLNFQGLDVLTILDLVLYIYTDQVVDFWHMTRQASEMAFRYRQTRVELMKIATKLEMPKLEAAARQMVQPRPCLNMDMEVAIADPAFFHDGDIVVQLEDDEIRIHSALICARCPFFDGLFMGRAGGRWLAGRDRADAIDVDLSHIDSNTFQMVLQHLYADSGAELFDNIVSVSVDDFIDAVMDVMSAANELMLDRLSQICQSVIGEFVNTRNVCGLLNAISPSSVHEFKDAALEYLCLGLEAMLQGHHLNELDEDLVLELDNVIRQNQLACMPFAKSGRAEMLLHERHPELAAAIDQNRRTKIDTIKVQTKYHATQSLALGWADEDKYQSTATTKSRRRSSGTKAGIDAGGPQLRPKASAKDMMFAMDEEQDGDADPVTRSPAPRAQRRLPVDLDNPDASPPEDIWFDSRGKVLPSPILAPQKSSLTAPATPATPATPRTPRSPQIGGRTPPSSGLPWNMTPLPGSKSDMKNIMEQAASNRTSSLSQGLAAAKSESPEVMSKFSLGAPKMSQKERKRLQHAQQSPSEGSHDLTFVQATSASKGRPVNPWRSVSSNRESMLRTVSAGPALQPSASTASPSISAPKSSGTHLNMRQTIANANSKNVRSPKPTVGLGLQDSPSTSPVVEPFTPVRSGTQTERPRSRRAVGAQSPQAPQPSDSRPIPHSIRYQPPVEVTIGLSMSEILAQQELEKSIIREATAKRDLQDIQAEQEFQEWWEKESARVQEAERNSLAAAVAASKGGKRAKGRGGGRGGSRSSGRGKNTGEQKSAPPEAKAS